MVRELKSIFARHGIPAKIMCDNGPPFNSEQFREFTQSWDIKHTTSSPHYDQSNGQVERSIQTLKILF